MSRPHEWRHERRNGAPTYACRHCGKLWDGLTGEACPVLVPALRERITRLAEEANELALDLIAARDAAEPGEKATWRYPLRHVEHAAALLGRAAK